MTDPKKILKKIRRKFKPPEKPEDPIKKLIARIAAEQERQKMWENDKRIKRDANFKQALLGLEVRKRQQEAEKERQEEIALMRLKNLKKARKVLQKQRENDDGE